MYTAVYRRRAFGAHSFQQATWVWKHQLSGLCLEKTDHGLQLVMPMLTL